MTPQSHFMVTAAITPGREPALRELLATMTTVPGAADPHNAVLPFAEFERLHYARLVVLDDATVARSRPMACRHRAIPSTWR